MGIFFLQIILSSLLKTQIDQGENKEKKNKDN